MKSLPVVLALSLLAGLAPFASAVEECSFAAPREETLRHPTATGRYLVIDLDDPTKSGEWEDNNRVAGIQTEDCGNTAVKWYVKDMQSVVLP